ncbi:pitrilysin family protein [Leptolyngbya sp. FACHB-261]|uniref:M16 family metallopeptidase n=1 Tax=Leptolyngbya sp. FACHB-261 TaxID=2692806 RepID=UPI0016861820|nr:pitrilysin family protein [Leptolyngbya sp. FACHB-261]MBD2103304.1 insulinase family protein [Leptolyngbya sp. FACHB-261]
MRQACLISTGSARARSLFCAFVVLLGLLLADPVWAREAAPAPPNSREPFSIQPYVEAVTRRITEFKLSNGMTFIVMERHEAPTVWFQTYVNVGGANEVPGQTGIAHFFEHLAFKGTSRIGTTNAAREKAVFSQMDQLDEQLRQARTKGDQAQIARLQPQFEKLKTEAASLVKRGELDEIISRQGGVNINAFTSKDATQYVYNFPANKLELWMSLESERFLDPVFREFYEERDVIQEERRRGFDNSPTGQLFARLLKEAYKVHPYQYTTIGSQETIQSLTRPMVQKFYRDYYVPHNMTIAIVGDVDPKRVKELAQAYFGRFRDRPSLPDPTVVEPAQSQQRRFTLTLPSQPWTVAAYHRPAFNQPDNAVYEIISSILSDGRTSRFYRSLVQQQQIALTAEGFNGYPGDKFPTLIVFYALPAAGHKVEEVETAMQVEIDRLINQPVSAAELARVQTQARAGLLGTLRSNQGMAGALLEYQVKTGDWRNLFKQVEAYAAVTPADIQRVARATFRPENQTIGRLIPAATPATPDPTSGPTSQATSQAVGAHS